MRDTRIAILGAGSVGVCAALELAQRGYGVDLYDENAQAVSRASSQNEGKIHLGLVYARDPSLRTARTMMLGAVHFAACLGRWIDTDLDNWPVSTPFYYAVHKGTMTSAEDLEGHYAQCTKLFAEVCASTGLSYLATDRTLVAEKLSRAEMEALVSPDYCLCAFRTSERSVDPRVIADRLRQAVCASPRIRFMPLADVRRVAWSGNRLQVTFRQQGAEHTEAYDQVANTLWHGRLQIDTTLGLAPERAWIYRYKLGGWITGPDDQATVPSLTFVLGPFGDIVNLGRRGVYVSWYPTGMVGTSRDVIPPDWETSIGAGERRVIVRRMYEELAKRCPALAGLACADDRVDPVGGVIFAWGETDIEHTDSRLHTRHEIGIHSVRNYHSVNTGKYTMAPYLGYKTAERILGIS